MVLLWRLPEPPEVELPEPEPLILPEPELFRLPELPEVELPEVPRLPELPEEEPLVLLPVEPGVVWACAVVANRPKPKRNAAVRNDEEICLFIRVGKRKKKGS